MPKFSDDDVLDFMVTEAVVAHAVQEEGDAQQNVAAKREQDAWKRSAANALPDG